MKNIKDIVINTVVKITCDYCGRYDEAGKNMVDLKGKRIRIGENYGIHI